ncbi:MAG: hypothetical protein OXM03_09155 [Chloroflexota bacterium]|nr:hypothetical protein [Chloroflexota bacterium]MDE2840780.1 hypothetical protein [Chloroflexota bacterium]MDE2929528.1 hypothetical protein [Chloroflexota bacterium]
MTLSEFRSSLRNELFDPADDEPRFSDADCDHAIDRALTELSRVAPWIRDATLTTSPESRLIDLSTLSAVWSVEEVEWPTGHYPPKRCTFMVLPTSDGAPGFVFLLVPEAPSGAESVRVRWGTKHVASDSQWTLPDNLHRSAHNGRVRVCLPGLRNSQVRQLPLPRRAARGGRGYEHGERFLVGERQHRPRSVREGAGRAAAGAGAARARECGVVGGRF